jgi:hypothetical protein
MSGDAPSNKIKFELLPTDGAPPLSTYTDHTSLLPPIEDRGNRPPVERKRKLRARPASPVCIDLTMPPLPSIDIKKDDDDDLHPPPLEPDPSNYIQQ